MLGAAASSPGATIKLNEKDYKRKDYKKRDYDEWGEEDEDQHVRNLYKAEKLLEDALYRQNMYTLSSAHYSNLNRFAAGMSALNHDHNSLCRSLYEQPRRYFDDAGISLTLSLPFLPPPAKQRHIHGAVHCGHVPRVVLIICCGIEQRSRPRDRLNSRILGDLGHHYNCA